jgi:uncharacterized protein YndB with AHSA1/START domain
MPAADAILEDRDGRVVLRFERTLRHPPERVWAALTEVDDLRRWHPTPAVMEPRAGGAFGDGEVITYAPPRELAYTWGEDLLRWTLTPGDGGTRLVLEHTFDDRNKAARDAAGWELCLGALAGALEGGDAAAPVGERAVPAGWEELNRRYQERFGIAPEEATPPPAR